jgi:hypothetical protein
VSLVTCISLTYSTVFAVIKAPEKIFQPSHGAYMYITVEPLYSGHLGTADSVLIKGGVLISGVILYLHVAGTKHSVLINGDVLISGVSL